MEKERLQELVSRVSDGVLKSFTNLILYNFFFIFCFPKGGKSSRAIWESLRIADKEIEKINYQTFKNVYHYLKRKGLVQVFKSQFLLPEITAAGKKRLVEILPVYDEKRTWDGRIYLISYDIAENRRNDRQLFRRYLSRLGCAMLQASLYLTPYNPRETLRKFIEKRDLSGSILISDLGKDGAIGRESLKELIFRIYNLGELNQRYQEFLNQFSHQERVRPLRASLAFLSILQKDPQLPFALLPKVWQGRVAYRLYKKIIEANKGKQGGIGG